MNIKNHNFEIDYINGVKTNEIFGRAKYQKEIYKRLPDVSLNVIEYNSLGQKIRNILSLQKIPQTNLKLAGAPTTSDKFIAKIGKILGDIDRYLKYPYIVKRGIRKNNIKHITCQELAYLLKLLNLKKTVVTCYDLIPWIYENNHSFGWKLNMSGLKKADRIITISEFSKNEIIKYLKYPEDRIDIIYPGVNHNNYYVKRDKNPLKRFHIPENTKTVLYVGSEMPRQNIPFLLNGFSELKKILPDVKLLKIGNPQWTGARKELLELTEKLNLQNDVIFVGYVKEKELARWYNAADLFVYPCLYTGWSLPCLEAMACGTPVITSNVSVLPEVVGDAGVTIDPYSVNELTEAMYDVLIQNDFRESLIQKGLQRVKLFNWSKAAEDTLKVYEKMRI